MVEVETLESLSAGVEARLLFFHNSSIRNHDSTIILKCITINDM